MLDLMTRVLRSTILTFVFIVFTLPGLWGWLAMIQSAFPFVMELTRLFGAFEQYLVILMGAPVLLLAGGFAYLLYEPQHRTPAVLAFALILGAILAWLAPTLLLLGRTWLVLAYGLSCAALSSSLVLLGAWCAALIQGRWLHRRGPCA
jgi:hypothetical protein